MDVPCDVVRAFRNRIEWMMGQQEISYLKGVMYLDSLSLVLIAAHDIVITLDKFKVD